ncbi:hypothetical protein M1L60_31965 [Actinoplanes sp. TRM 88003]|uniref:Uncharacterized protein n=1 Tax=Paractinoplanes aksuensis TaxID=2939490 RepID=A0ABT1DWH9_9ACTN|nr:hypothetical protein [Actinoplanes aksuensis]MCO8275208.1 hypothetical protein [Actinoplanes aksuensis]
MRGRYGGPAEFIAFAGIFVVLILLAVGTLIAGAHIMSNGCIVGTSQDLCPINGPEWSRPLPAYAIALGVLSGFVGLAAGRPVRNPALTTGYVLVATGLLISLLIG